MYCTITDIIGDLTEIITAQLSNDDSTSKTVDESILTQYISDASDLIDGYLRSRYPLPLISEYAIIKKVCIDLVKYELYKRRNRMNDFIQKVQDTAISTLDKIQKGIIKFDEGTPANRPGFYLVSKRDSVFPKNIWKNY